TPRWSSAPRLGLPCRPVARVMLPCSSWTGLPATTCLFMRRTWAVRMRKLRKEADERVISGKEYEARLRGHHAKLNPFTGWADMDRKAPLRDGDSDEEEGGVDNMLRNNDELVVKGTAKLLPGMLDYSRLVDANAQDPSSGPINSVQFHRNGQLMLVAGLDKHLRFFQIDGKRNPKIQSIFVEDCPIQKAAFLPDGSE
uniref:Uncharacterized protein n=1 Tax=Aegilops tauschii subsp. strangulata TaxID=200361 RepID=A0A453M2H3_AEGTS